jgi:hypothetical protein
MKNKHTAWAVEVTYPPNGSIPEYKFLAGRYYFCNMVQRYESEYCTEGCKTALFTTRAIARSHAKRCFYPAKAVKVSIEIRKI